jgi:hypothetical protein
MVNNSSHIKNEQPPLTQTIEHKKATTYGVRNPGPPNNPVSSTNSGVKHHKPNPTI